MATIKGHRQERIVSDGERVYSTPFEIVLYQRPGALEAGQGIVRSDPE